MISLPLPPEAKPKHWPLGRCVVRETVQPAPGFIVDAQPTQAAVDRRVLPRLPAATSSWFRAHPAPWRQHRGQELPQIRQPIVAATISQFLLFWRFCGSCVRCKLMQKSGHFTHEKCDSRRSNARFGSLADTRDLSRSATDHSRCRRRTARVAVIRLNIELRALSRLCFGKRRPQRFEAVSNALTLSLGVLVKFWRLRLQ